MYWYVFVYKNIKIRSHSSEQESSLCKIPSFHTVVSPRRETQGADEAWNKIE